MGKEVKNSARTYSGGGRQAGSEFPFASECSTSPRRSSMTLTLGESMNVVHWVTGTLWEPEDFPNPAKQAYEKFWHWSMYLQK